MIGETEMLFGITYTVLSNALVTVPFSAVDTVQSAVWLNYGKNNLYKHFITLVHAV